MPEGKPAVGTLKRADAFQLPAPIARPSELNICQFPAPASATVTVSTFEIPSGPGQSDYFLEMGYLTPGAYQVVLRDGKGRFWREKVIKY